MHENSVKILLQQPGGATSLDEALTPKVLKSRNKLALGNIDPEINLPPGIEIQNKLTLLFMGRQQAPPGLEVTRINILAVLCCCGPGTSLAVLERN